MIKNQNSIIFLRKKNIKRGLCSSDLTKDPIDLFKIWFKQFCSIQIPNTNAMIIGTVDQHGQSYQRAVLLKYFNHSGMIFYTNTNSRKAIHIRHNAKVSLLFPWQIIERQVLILGTAKKISISNTEKYFRNRSRNSQISSWASYQSQKIASRDVLEKKFLNIKKFFYLKKIPTPNFWRGYHVTIEEVEFWQGRQHRLHDRFLYQKGNMGWKISRLSP